MWAIYGLNPDAATYSRTSMAQTLWNHENIFETGVVQANEC